MTNIAAIQMVSTTNVAENLTTAESLIKKAADNGANIIVLPENFALIGKNENDKLAIAEIEGQGPIQSALSSWAAQHNVILVAGTIPLQGATPNKARASCLVYDSAGKQLARYDKMHLFDVDVDDNHGRYRESAVIEPGDRLQVVTTEHGKLGLSVCYDLRFPELYRQLVKQGAEILIVPAAFTAITGKAHWEVLLRARAIENLSFVVAPNQGGHHPCGRETYGHSLIIDPWGTIMAQQAQGEGVISADIDLTQCHTIRERFPALGHRMI